MKAVFLVIYLLGAIGTAWCLSPRIAGGDRRAFLSVSSVLWPFTVTVFGVIVLLALLAHWYDRLAASLQTHVRDSSAATRDICADPTDRMSANSRGASQRASPGRRS